MKIQIKAKSRKKVKKQKHFKRNKKTFLTDGRPQNKQTCRSKNT